ncbi:MAG: twin-arginine translocase TatA/TatE family subunit [Coriobacteriia bacterium]
MAFFGLPGGAEWLIIGGIVVLLFVPGALAFWFGYMSGKSAGIKEAAPTPAPVAAPEVTGTAGEDRDDA